jgi:hypothetical protein
LPTVEETSSITVAAEVSPSHPLYDGDGLNLLGIEDNSEDSTSEEEVPANLFDSHSEADY